MHCTSDHALSRWHRSPPIWAVVSIKSILRSAAICEAQLQSLFTGPIVFKRIPGGLRFKSDETVRP